MNPTSEPTASPKNPNSKVIWRHDIVEAGRSDGEAGGLAEADQAPDDSRREMSPINVAANSLERIRQWNRIGISWLGDAYARLTGRSQRFEEAVHRYTAWLETVDHPADIKNELLVLVGRLLPASRSELILASDNVNHRREEGPIKAWSRGATAPEKGSAVPNASYWIEEFPLKWGRAEFGRLRVISSGRSRLADQRRWSCRLKTICGLAACALENLRLGATWPEDGDQWPSEESFTDRDRMLGTVGLDCPTHDPTMLHDATFLNAVLPFVIGQALRHREPLALVCVAIDRLHGIQELLGRAVADSLVRWVGETVSSMIRASDIVARLDDDRVVAVMPRSGDEGALRIGEMICEKVAEARWPLAYQPGMKITVSVGAATFPSSAENVYSLFEAADDALAQAQAHGRNRAVLAPRIPVAPQNEALVPNGSLKSS
jgi:diguanylate cyclase (GGDEF)-like protein